MYIYLYKVKKAYIIHMDTYSIYTDWFGLPSVVTGDSSGKQISQTMKQYRFYYPIKLRNLVFNDTSFLSSFVCLKCMHEDKLNKQPRAIIC